MFNIFLYLWEFNKKKSTKQLINIKQETLTKHRQNYTKNFNKIIRIDLIIMHASVFGNKQNET